MDHSHLLLSFKFNIKPHIEKWSYSNPAWLAFGGRDQVLWEVFTKYQFKLCFACYYKTYLFLNQDVLFYLSSYNN